MLLPEEKVRFLINAQLATATASQPTALRRLSRDDHRQIIAEVEAHTTAIDHLEAELDRQITRSNRLRQSTLASAFKGNLSD